MPYFLQVIFGPFSLTICAQAAIFETNYFLLLSISRHTFGDYIFAYIPDSEAPDISTKTCKLLKKDHQSPRTVTASSSTQNNNTHMVNHNSHKFHPVMLSSRSCTDTSSSYASTTHTRPSDIPLYEGDDISDVTVHRPAAISDCKPKGKQKLTHVAPKAPATITLPLERSEPDVFCLPDLSSNNSQSVPSLSGDSQSQDSTSAGMSTATSHNPEFVLRPGSFEIILCVDNQEFYGG
jgi:hypothetical protein